VDAFTAEVIRNAVVAITGDRRDYGVVINAVGRHFALDVTATEALRRAMSGKSESGRGG